MIESPTLSSHPGAPMQDVYPSRLGTKPEWIDRVDPVVHSPGPPPDPWSPSDAEFFDRNGFLIAESLFNPAEVRSFSDELERLAALPDLQDRPEAITEPDSGALRSLFAVHELSPVFARLARDPRILGWARHVLGDEVYVHQSRVNLKPGFHGKEFYWHSDFETWHVEDGMPRMRAISVSVALTPNSEFNGPLLLVPGSHRHYIACVGETPENNYQTSLKRQEIGVPDPESLRRLTELGGIVSSTGPAGSTTFFDCNTMHGSSSNISPFPRSNVFLVFNAVSNRVTAPFCGRPPRPDFIATRKNPEPLR